MFSRTHTSHIEHYELFFSRRWIDLIFGVKARDNEAAAAKNAFVYLTDADAVDVDAVDDAGLRAAAERAIAR
jgi:hypothetical protein